MGQRSVGCNGSDFCIIVGHMTENSTWQNNVCKENQERYTLPYNFFNLSSLFPIFFIWSLTSAPNCCFVVFFSIRLVCRSAFTAAFLAFLSSFDSFRGRVIVSRRGTISRLKTKRGIIGRKVYRHCQNPQIHLRYL